MKRHIALACGIGLLWGGTALAFLRAAPDVLPVEPAESSRPEKPSPPVMQVEQDRFRDVENSDFPLLQKPLDALSGFPLDKQGRVDWSGALLGGVITPRASLTPGVEQDLLDLDVIMRNTRAMPHVRFSHLAHTRWLTCANCHPNPFPYRAGILRINMADIFRGKHCGMCHDRVAFVTWQSCERCHSVPRSRPPQ